MSLILHTPFENSTSIIATNTYYKNNDALIDISIVHLFELCLDLDLVRRLPKYIQQCDQNNPQLKVSKFRKHIILISYTPKTQRNFSHFFALASKKSIKIVQTIDKGTKILI